MRITLKTDDGVLIDEIQMPHKRWANLDLSKPANWVLFIAMLKEMFVAAQREEIEYHRERQEARR
jgi:hypothetical protein